MDKVKDRLMTVLLCYNFLQKKKNKNLFLFSSIIYLTFISRFDKEPIILAKPQVRNRVSYDPSVAKACEG